MDPVTDEQVQALAATAQPFSFMQLRWAGRHLDSAAAIELEHQRRMVTLHRDGVIALLCPVQDDSAGGVAGVAIMTEPADRATEIMAADPCVRAGMMSVEVLPCVGFPGDTIPG